MATPLVFSIPEPSVSIRSLTASLNPVHFPSAVPAAAAAAPPNFFCTSIRINCWASYCFPAATSFLTFAICSFVNTTPERRNMDKPISGISNALPNCMTALFKSVFMKEAISTAASMACLNVSPVMVLNVVMVDIAFITASSATLKLLCIWLANFSSSRNSRPNDPLVFFIAFCSLALAAICSLYAFTASFPNLITAAPTATHAALANIDIF